MIVNRRTFSAMVASAVAAPRMSFAQVNDRSAPYSGVGGQLTHFEVDFGAATLAKRASVKLPGGIQYAWPHPSRKYLYVATSSGRVGTATGLRIFAQRTLSYGLPSRIVRPTFPLCGDPIKLKQRPIHTSVDRAGAYVLVAYNYPSNVSVYKIKRDGGIGDEVKLADNLSEGDLFPSDPGNPIRQNLS